MVYLAERGPEAFGMLYAETLKIWRWRPAADASQVKRVCVCISEKLQMEFPYGNPKIKLIGHFVVLLRF